MDSYYFRQRSGYKLWNGNHTSIKWFKKKRQKVWDESILCFFFFFFPAGRQREAILCPAKWLSGFHFLLDLLLGKNNVLLWNYNRWKPFHGLPPSVSRKNPDFHTMVFEVLHDLVSLVSVPNSSTFIASPSCSFSNPRSCRLFLHPFSLSPASGPLYCPRAHLGLLLPSHTSNLSYFSKEPFQTTLT